MKYLSLLFLLLSLHLNAQINFTANDQVPDYNGDFGYGVNGGWNSGWNDQAEADIAAGNPALGVPGVGCNTIRPTLPESFLEFWGYDIRVNEYQYFESLGINDLTVFIGFPSEEHRDPNSYCPGSQSQLFENMYLPIWDNGENGTPVNDDNYYALYLYNMVNTYQDYVTFWEIWNEPDFDYSSSGWLEPGQTGNWWENVPDPCDYTLQAPVYHYIRLLRISYEVIKFVDPEAFVAVGGIGYESFLDIILRYSDNPDNGIITPEFPMTGGAYFDVLSYHSYPHFSLKEYDIDIEDFIFFRHSDAAMQEVILKKSNFQTVLNNYGYDGNTYPEKAWIITESNVPAEKFNPDYFGSISGQRNFIIKTLVACQKNDILQFHIYKLGENQPVGEGYNEFDRMGLYENLDDIGQYNQIATEAGIAYKTSADLIGDASYNHQKTMELNLSDDIDGAAFLHPDDSYTYVLWAKTSIDDSELAAGIYSFPSSMNINALEKRTWNFSQTNEVNILGSDNIILTGDPIFLHELTAVDPLPNAEFTFSINSSCAPYLVAFTDLSSNNPTDWNWSFPGGNPSVSSQQNPVVIYENPGSYTATLLVTNDSGNHSTNLSFDLEGEVTYELNSELCLGDHLIVNGTLYDESNPSGTEVIMGGSANGCDSTVIIDLTFNEIIEEYINATICFEETYLFGGETISEAGNYIFETSTNSGCDSIANLNLSVEEALIFNNEVILCSGDLYNGIEYLEDAFLSDTLTSSNNCDSIINLTTITVKPTFFTPIEETIQEGELYVVGNSIYSVSGIYYDIFTAQNGCDSIVELTLNVEVVDGIYEFNDPKTIDLKAFPNPFSKVVNIEFKSTAQDFISLKIFNSNGQVVSNILKSDSYQNDFYHFNLDFGKASKGIYWCQVHLENGVYIQKLVLL